MTPAPSELPRFAVLLRQARTELALGQVEASERLGVSRSTLSNAENGRGTPGIFTRIEEAYPAQAEGIVEAWLEHNSKEPANDADDMFFNQRNRRKIDGEWHALWQTTADGEPNFNTEVLDASWVRGASLRVANRAASDDNPIGGYRWTANLAFHDNTFLLGVYLPVDSDVGSKGTLFGVVNRSGRSVRGRWVGCNVDSEITTGCFVFSRSRDQLRKLMAGELGTTTESITFGTMETS